VVQGGAVRFPNNETLSALNFPDRHRATLPGRKLISPRVKQRTREPSRRTISR
jgi:hypothetical protein